MRDESLARKHAALFAAMHKAVQEEQAAVRVRVFLPLHKWLLWDAVRACSCGQLLMPPQSCCR